MVRAEAKYETEAAVSIVSLGSELKVYPSNGQPKTLETAMREARNQWLEFVGLFVYDELAAEEGTKGNAYWPIDGSLESCLVKKTTLWEFIDHIDGEKVEKTVISCQAKNGVIANAVFLPVRMESRSSDDFPGYDLRIGWHHRNDVPTEIAPDGTTRTVSGNWPGDLRVTDPESWGKIKSESRILFAPFYIPKPRQLWTTATNK